MSGLKMAAFCNKRVKYVVRQILSLKVVPRFTYKYHKWLMLIHSLNAK